MEVKYTDSNIRTIEGLKHIRHRPGMYIGKTGDGTFSDDGIYVLLKEVLDNSIDEFRQKEGNQIQVTIQNGTVTVRDFGRGIPQGKMIDAVSTLNTSGKFDSEAFQKSIGLNGVGVKAVNALSSKFVAISYREGKAKRIEFKEGELTEEVTTPSDDPRGTFIQFTPDNQIFENFRFREEFVETMLRNYSYLNVGLSIVFNGKKFVSKNGLMDLLTENISAEMIYPIVHLKADDIEIAFTHTLQYGEEYYSFVNGQHTTQGGTHQSALRESFGRTIKEYYNKNMDLADIRGGLVAAIYIAVQEPEFESQTKIKLGSKNMSKDPDSISVNKFVSDFIKKEVDNYLHKNLEVADILLKKIQDAERERKAISGVQKLARERAKKVSLHNKKLRDCRVHFNQNDERKKDSSIFITEGDSASGSITKSRNVNTQAVFSLRGKPLNSFGLSKKVVYENEEFNLLQAALNIEDGLDDLRYNKVIVATDADVDGMHIRLLLLTFFLQFFPELVKKGHVYILQTPLFRVRNKRKKGRDEQGKGNKKDSDFETIYCYSEEERLEAVEKLKPNPEITRFKGLGEISPDEFKEFIGENIRLEQVSLHKGDSIKQLLEFYMGKNTPLRQEFIIDNLYVEKDEA